MLCFNFVIYLLVNILLFMEVGGAHQSQRGRKKTQTLLHSYNRQVDTLESPQNVRM